MGADGKIGADGRVDAEGKVGADELAAEGMEGIEGIEGGELSAPWACGGGAGVLAAGDW